jgi:CHASE3 domain sensor protein/class 3 adenylate cyclase
MNLSLQKKVLSGFCISSALLVMLTYSGYHTSRQLENLKEWEIHTKQVLRLLEEISTDLSDAETGQRGYLLTQDDQYLEPYQDALTEIEEVLSLLISLTDDNQIQQRNLQVLSRLIDQKLSELGLTIELSKNGQNQAAIELVKTHEGKNLMNQIRQVLSDTKDEEERLFKLRSQATDELIQQTLLVWGLGILFELGLLSFLYWVIYREVSEKQSAQKKLIKLNEAAFRFVPQKLIQILNKESILDVRLGDYIEAEMSIMFSDIRDFTSLSEEISPEDNFKLINAYLSRMAPAIHDHYGFIDKYIGDGIMALFGRSPDDAVQAGISMLRILNEYNYHRHKCGYAPLKIGIGINTGRLILGTVGYQNHIEGTVISDAVNLASRIESLTKIYQVPLLISESTYVKLKNKTEYGIRFIDTVQVKGRFGHINVYEVFSADFTDNFGAKLSSLPQFLEAVSLYHQKRFTDSLSAFKDCYHQNPNDSVVNTYLQRLKTFC